MADMAKFIAALAGIGETLNRATNATQDEFLLMPPHASADNKAATVAVDSLINFEAVKVSSDILTCVTYY